MRSLISVTVLALTLTACGGGDDGGNESELRSSAEDYFVAFFEPDSATAYDLLSERCKQDTTEDEFADLLDLAQSAYGQVDVEITSVEVDGNEGTVTGETGIPALDEDNGDGPNWVYEDGGWKSDACD